MNRITEEGLERNGDDDLRALSCTIKLILEGRRKHALLLHDLDQTQKRVRPS